MERAIGLDFFKENNVNNGVIISPEIDAVIRWAVGVLAGFLVQKANIDPTQVTTISGVILGAVAIAWSIWQKNRTQAATVSHVLTAATTGQVPDEVKETATLNQQSAIRAAGK